MEHISSKNRNQRRALQLKDGMIELIPEECLMVQKYLQPAYFIGVIYLLMVNEKAKSQGRRGD